jgi:hypothetical protein
MLIRFSEPIFMGLSAPDVEALTVQRGSYMTLESVATVSNNPIVLLSAEPA